GLLLLPRDHAEHRRGDGGRDGHEGDRSEDARPPPFAVSLLARGGELALGLGAVLRLDVAGAPVEDRRSENVVEDLVARSVAVAGRRRDRSQDADVAARELLE